MAPGSSSKLLREKIVCMYENLLNGDDVNSQLHFWDEFFVLKPKQGYFLKYLKSIKDDEILLRKAALQNGVQQAIERLDLGNNSELSFFNALLTLSMLVEDLTNRQPVLDPVDILFGELTPSCEHRLNRMFGFLKHAVQTTTNQSLLMLTFRFLIRLVVVKKDINENPFVACMMVQSFFEDFMGVISDPVKRNLVGQETVALLGILPHFSTSEPEANPYMQLSVMDPSIELMGIAAVIGQSFRDTSKTFFQQVIALQKDSTWVSWLTKTVTRSARPTLSVDLKDTSLLALCTGLKIGRNFVHAFTHAQSEILVNAPPPTPTPDGDNSSITSEPAIVTPKDTAVVEPSNLFVEFLQYASIVMQHIKDEKPSEHARMSLIILSVITEDHYTTQFMHDFSINYRVQFFRSASRYHPCQILKSAKPEPLACAVLNLISEFIMSHMMLNFPHDLYFRCLLIVYRLMDYQKRTRFRLPYQWRTLWGSLLALLKFLESNESYLMEQMSNFFLLCTQVVNILNIFLIGGDAILSQVGSYDDLCYEIVRNSSMVSSASAMGLRYSSVQSASMQATAKRFLSALTNLRSVVQHFTPKIDAFSLEFQKVTMEREEILNIIRTNYDNLSLKLVDMTECFEKNSNGSKDKPFLTSFVANTILDLRQVYAVSDSVDVFTIGDDSLVQNL
ncbi:UPF0668 protein C10orf76-like protein [Hypsibius exemplaris]|uniref:UPF0668 protein C10orf76-like protein n=1 Tax=Hypsibius exemplaris TaxID=2072580 RepID=A0A1W0WSJ8_HYPEX|nr:UPF0668 protein C10orf76-like protein [Hypsibius exemplaris]